MAIALDRGVVVSRVTLRYQNPKCRHHRIRISESHVDETGADVSPSSSSGKSFSSSHGVRIYMAVFRCEYGGAVQDSTSPKTVCHSRYGHIDVAFLRYEFGCEQLERSSE